MIKFKNLCYLNYLRVINKIRKKIGKHSILLSSRKTLEINFKAKTKFNFVQIGGNDGVSFDFLYDFVSSRDSEGIILEPVLSYFKELENNYAFNKKIKKINKAIHPTLKEIKIYKINPDYQNQYPEWVKGIASLDPNHHKKTNIDSKHILEELVSADSLTNVLSQSKTIKNLNYFQIDTEGFDFEILKMIDFNIIEPQILKYESVNLSEGDKQNAIALLIDQGYYVFNEKGDTVAINIKKIKLF